MALKVIMLGDIVGKPGKRVVHQQLEAICKEHRPDIVIANAENIAGGSGITPELYQKLKSYGIDGITLGDHVYRQKEIIPTLAGATDITRPANLPDAAAGRPWMKLQHDSTQPPLYVITLLGRIFMNGPVANDPFATADRMLRQFPADAAVLVEVHCETTSEKVAIAHFLDGRVSAVIGTHTHVPTADARILPGGTAFITDIGMCGPYDSVIGRKKDRVVEHMSTGMPTVFDVAEGDVRACGVLVEIGLDRKAKKIQRLEYPADPNRPPFSS